MYKISAHGLYRYASRTGVSLLDAAQTLPAELSAAIAVDKHQASRLFTVTHSLPGDKYLVWYVPRIREYVLAIVRRDQTVATVLTERLLGFKLGKVPILNLSEDRAAYLADLCG